MRNSQTGAGRGSGPNGTGVAVARGHPRTAAVSSRARPPEIAAHGGIRNAEYVDHDSSVAKRASGMPFVLGYPRDLIDLSLLRDAILAILASPGRPSTLFIPNDIGAAANPGLVALPVPGS